MKPVVIKNSRVPKLFSIFINVAAITIWPFVFIREGCESDRLINHESIHIHQYGECFVIGFYLIYLWDWVHGLLKYKDSAKAYLRIRFEQEAYAHDQNLDYLVNRKKHAWRAYRV
jgi:hypothetical protein